MVGASFGLAQLTQTRYDHRDRHHRKVYIIIFFSLHLAYFQIMLTPMIQVAKEEALGMEKNRRQFSLQEEYWVNGYLPI